MKPLKLTMKAFGAYADETVVDFDQLRNGLFLITGDTGAGKTTIFDAMVFALFGKASGTNREYRMFHSDYVDKGVDTEVTFTFSHNGQVYEVYRNIHFARSAKTKTYSDKPEITKQYLKEGNGEAIEKNITERIEELIGLNVDQFRKIVMLAQGEFQAFLKADNNSKKTILGNLFDSSAYVSFQDRLDEAEKKLRKQNELLNNQLSTVINKDTFPLPDTLDEVEKQKYHPNHPSVIENIEELISREEKEINALDIFIKDTNEMIQSLNTRLHDVQRKNDELVILDNLLKEKVVLESKKDEIITKKQQLEQAEIAYRKVYPLEKEYQRVYGEYDKAKILLESNSSSLKNKEQELQEKVMIVEKNIPLYKDVQVYVTKMHDIESKLGEYERLEQLRTQTKSLLTTVETLDKEIVELDARIVNGNALVESNKEKMVAFEQAVTTADACYKVYSDASNHVDVVNEYRKNVDSLIAENTKYEQHCKRLNELMDKAKIQSATYLQLYQRFIAGQAGIIAKDLVTEIELQGEGVCPVCHTHLVSKDVTYLASSVIDVCTQEDVDVAKNAFDTTDQLRRNEQVNVDTVKAKIEQIKDACFLLVQKLGLSNDDKMYTKDFVIAVQSDVIKTYEEAKKKYEETVHAKEQLEQLKVDQEKYSKAIQSLVDSKEVKVQGKQKVEVDYAQSKTALESLMNTLPEVSKEIAEQKLAVLRQEKESLEKKLLQDEQNRDVVNNVVQELRGVVQGNQVQIDTLLTQMNSAKDMYKNVINEYFSTEDKYHICLGYIDTIQNADAWIKQMNDMLVNYQHSVMDNQKRIEEQQEKTKDFVKVDTIEIENEVSKLQGELEPKVVYRTTLIGNKSLHIGVCKTMKSYKKQIDLIKPAYLRLQRLNDIANAKSSSEGGKYNFESYSLANTFKEILQAANARLNHMSGGKYELIHETKASRSSSQAGFDIKVLDAFTNEIRDSASLSGGETFEVSMSLALGLSDVVQAHANGKKIDAIFIDEGFGSLDEALLIKAKNVLEDIAGDSKQIGIISHVSKLDEIIPQKIVVKGSNKGSTLSIKI